MNGSAGDDAPSWREHAEELGRQLLALDAMLAMSDPADPDAMDRFVDRLDGLAQGPDGDEVLEGFESALCLYALQFARAAHGDRFREVLAERRAQLRAHMDDYEPRGDVR